MNKNKGVLLTAVGLTVGLLGVGIPVAANAGNSAYCDAVYVCIYKDAGFVTGLGARTTGFSLQNISAANNDEVSSWENRTSRTSRWYTDPNGTGTCNTMVRYTELNYMDPFSQNDKMSSWSGTSGC